MSGALAGSGGPVLWAVGCAATAAWLLQPPPPRLAGARSGRWPPAVSLAGPALVLGVVVGGSPQLLVTAAVLGVAVLGAGRLVTQRRRGREVVRTSTRVLETCDELAAELAAGAPPGAALGRAATSWPALEPAAAAFRMGADVPDALRALARRPGAGDLRLVAAAWQVAHRTGHGLADALDGVGAELRATAATRRVVDGELASARATARLVAGLPLLALLMGSGAGGDPWGFLLGHPAGLVCLAGGLALELAGLGWIEALARDAAGVG